MQADLKKNKIFDWKKRSTEEVHRRGEISHRAVGPDKQKKNQQ